jgi:hypothetical protein
MAGGSSFTAGGGGDVDADSSGVDLDFWTIDQVRNLVTVNNDCAT